MRRAAAANPRHLHAGPHQTGGTSRFGPKARSRLRIGIVLHAIPKISIQLLDLDRLLELHAQPEVVDILRQFLTTERTSI